MGNFSQAAEQKLDSEVFSSTAVEAVWDNWGRGVLIFKTAPPGCSAVTSSVPEWLSVGRRLDGRATR